MLSPDKRVALRSARAASAVAIFALVAACAGTEDSQVMFPIVLGMPETTTPFYDDGTTRLYEVAMPVSLPVRRPTDAERRALGRQAPYPRAPFFVSSDARISIRFTLSNLSSDPETFELLVDPWNEFVRYSPGAPVVGTETVMPNLSGIDRFFVLAPMSRIEGTITPDDMVELAIDLATVQSIAQNPPAADSGFAGPVLFNRAFNIQNRSNTHDPLLSRYIPPVIAGLTGFDIGLRSSSPMKVAVEILVDVTDFNGDRILPAGSTERPIGPPGTYLTPPQAP